MTQFSEAVDNYGEESSSGMGGALYSFDLLRTELAEQSADQWRPRRARDEVVSAREVAMMAELTGMHDALSAIDQLRVYRFFLTAVHRNSLALHRFDANIVAFPERAAAIERELDEVNSSLNQLIEQTATYSTLHDSEEAYLQAANFLWTMVWWLHTRPDVTDFKFPAGDDVLSTLLLGRGPDTDEPVTTQMYAHAIKAEHDFRRMLMRKTPDNIVQLHQRGDFESPHVPLHMRAESHM